MQAAEPGIWTAKNYIDTPQGATGYRGIFIYRSLGDGINGEVQVHTPASWELKKITDKLYQPARQWTGLPAEKIPQADNEQKNAMEKESKRLWTEFYAGMAAEEKAAASSSLSQLASDSSPQVPLKGDQPAAGWRGSKTSDRVPGRFGSRSSTRPSDNLAKRDWLKVGIGSAPSDTGNIAQTRHRSMRKSKKKQKIPR